MAVNLYTLFQQKKDRIVDAVFPRFCLRCGEEGGLLCDQCFVDWEPGDVQVDEQVVALFPYADAVTRDLIRSWKYHFDYSAWGMLKKKMAPRLHVLSLMARARGTQAIIPVPLHEARFCERGFDQANVFAQQLSAELGVPVLQALYRDRATEQQSEKSEQERKIAMTQSPFLAVKQAPDSVLLVDDVYTTGATSQAAIDTLKAAGAQRAFVCTIAKG